MIFGKERIVEIEKSLVARAATDPVRSKGEIASIVLVPESVLCVLCQDPEVKVVTEDNGVVAVDEPTSARRISIRRIASSRRSLLWK